MSVGARATEGVTNGAQAGAIPSAGNRPVTLPKAPAPNGAGTRRVLSLGLVVSAAAASLLAAALLTAGLIYERNAQRILIRELEARLLLETRNLALTSAEVLLDGFPELTLQPIIRDLLAQRPELAFVAVTDRDGMVQGNADPRRLGSYFELPSDLRVTTSSSPLRPGEELRSNPATLAAMVRVHSATGQHVGFAYVGMKRDHLSKILGEARRRQLMVLVPLVAVGGLMAFALMSLLLRPIATLRRGLERIGRGDLDTRLEIRDQTELGLLAETVNQMTGELKVAQAQALERERLASEVELARRIQQSLLPSGRMECGDFVITGFHRAAAEVGGDYFDMLALPDGRVGLAIADVAGKGVPGCLVMSMLSVLLRTFSGAASSPGQALTALEQSLSRTLRRGTFITMFYGVLDPRRGTLVYASAGHSPTLLYRGADATVEWHRTTSIPLGAVRGGVPQGDLADQNLQLLPGDMLVQFTDGFHEAAEARSGEQFGFQRMEDLVRSHAHRGPEAVMQALADAVDRWSGSENRQDDETLLVVTRAGAFSATQGSDAKGETATEIETRVASPSVVPGPESLLERAARDGHRLDLAASLDQLVHLRGWLQECPELAVLDVGATRVLESALYEACANVIEHGYAGQPEARLDLWWIPADRRGAPDRRSQVRNGWFVLRDQGTSFDLSRRTETNLADPQVRRRGRGLGLEMIHRSMAQVAYFPATPFGNVTVLKFDPARVVRVAADDTAGDHR